jgi:hypothetical protein
VYIERNSKGNTRFVSTRSLPIIWTAPSASQRPRPGICQWLLAITLETSRNSTQYVRQSAPGNGWTYGARQQHNNFCVAFASTMARTRQTRHLKWNLRTTLLVRSERSTHPPRLTLAFHVRSHLSSCSACDLRFRFCKMRQSG